MLLVPVPVPGRSRGPRAQAAPRVRQAPWAVSGPQLQHRGHTGAPIPAAPQSLVPSPQSGLAPVQPQPHGEGRGTATCLHRNPEGGPQPGLVPPQRDGQTLPLKACCQRLGPRLQTRPQGLPQAPPCGQPWAPQLTWSLNLSSLMSFRLMSTLKYAPNMPVSRALAATCKATGTGLGDREACPVHSQQGA